MSSAASHAGFDHGDVADSMDGFDNGVKRPQKILCSTFAWSDFEPDVPAAAPQHQRAVRLGLVSRR